MSRSRSTWARCEWGAEGIEALAAEADVVIIVDVLSFSTAVEVATARGALVRPARPDQEDLQAIAQASGAVIAGRRGHGGFSLSPESVLGIAPGTLLILPSPNGANLSTRTGSVVTLAGCLRNARAVAHAAAQLGSRIAVIPAGERWPNGSLRPAVEDWIGAGAILDALGTHDTPEAQAAIDAFRGAEADLTPRLLQCLSGRELIERGYECDVTLAAELNISRCVPRLSPQHTYERWSV